MRNTNEGVSLSEIVTKDSPLKDTMKCTEKNIT